MSKLILPIMLLGLITGCTKVYLPESPTPVPPPVEKPIKDTVEFRVLGNANSARVRYSNSLDGLTQTTTVLPFQTSIVSTKETIFLSLEATPLSYSVITFTPFLSIQILVNGNIFREASNSSFLLDTLIVSGTFRHGS